MQKRHSVEHNFSNFLGMHGSSMPRASGNNCKIKNQHCSTSPANVTLKAVQITIWQIFIKITRLKLRINTNCFKHYYSVTNFNSHLGLSSTPFVAVSKEFPLLLVSYLCWITSCWSLWSFLAARRLSSTILSSSSAFFLLSSISIDKNS